MNILRELVVAVQFIYYIWKYFARNFSASVCQRCFYSYSHCV